MEVMIWIGVGHWDGGGWGNREREGAYIRGQGK